MTRKDSNLNQSILQLIEASGHKAPKVFLRELESSITETDPAAGEVTPVRSVRERRYETLGVIAEGSVSTIYKCRDVDLGRAAALKVLRADLLDDAEAVSRFVEESQIAGQLQHPSIVNVFELGLDPDGRPWFAMNLVRGKSLAARLAGRKSVRHGLRRYLAIFEEVCQAIGYAHTRGVIHRDLKPGNVMVGGFGEVQVVDWANARILPQGGIEDERRLRRSRADITRIDTVRSSMARDQAMATTMIGTPAYMPPEQALGLLDDMDRRSDVFSLGAMLCEILTGAPPYTGEAREALEKAAGARLDEVKARLSAPHVDQDLAELVLRCLSPILSQRPKDGGELAAAMTAWLGKVEENAHRDRLDAIESRRAADVSRTRSEREQAATNEQRKKRRHSIAISTSILLVLLCVGGFVAWLRADSDSRSRELATAVRAARHEAAVHLGNKSYPQALEAAQRSVDLAETSGAQFVVQQEAKQYLARVIEEKERADRETLRASRDLRLTRRLEEIPPPIGDDVEPGRSARLYYEAFLAHGLDISELAAAGFSVSLTAAEYSPRFAAACDRWAMLAPEHREKLAQAAAKISPNQIREQIWAKVRSQDVRGLLQLADSRAMEKQPAEIAALLALALRDLGETGEARKVLESASTLHPRDVQILLLLAREAQGASPPDEEGAGRALAGALALRPDSVEIRHRLAARLDSVGDVRTALRLWEEAARRQPDWALLHTRIAGAHARLEQGEAALAAARKAVELDPDSRDARLALVRAHGLCGDRDAAGAAARQALGIAGKGGAEIHLLLAQNLLSRQLHHEAREVLFELLRLRPSPEIVAEANGMLDHWDALVGLYGDPRAVESGQAVPADPAQAALYARYCTAERMHAAAATYYQAALSMASPSLDLYVDGARSAARAGLGQGRDGAALSAKERLKWRIHARIWLEEAVEPMRVAARAGVRNGVTAEQVAAAESWLADPAIYQLFRPRGSLQLESYESSDWRRLYEEIEDVLAAAGH